MSFLRQFSSGFITAALILQNVPVKAQVNFYDYVISHSEAEICEYVNSNAGDLSSEYDLTDYKKLNNPVYVWRSIKADSSLNAQSLGERIKSASDSLIYDREYLCDNYLLYYRNDYDGTGGRLRMLVNTSGPFSAYSTYGLAEYKLEDTSLICDMEFSLYTNAFGSDRVAGSVYGDVYATAPYELITGEYNSESDTYKNWTEYFKNRKNPLYELRLKNFPETEANWVLSGERPNGTVFYSYTGMLKHDVSKLMDKLSGDTAVVWMSNSGGENVSFSYDRAKMTTGIDLTRDNDNKYALSAVNGAKSGEELYPILTRYAEYFGITASDNSVEICDEMLEASQEFTNESVKTEFERALEHKTIKENALVEINALNIECSATDLIAALKKYNDVLKIEEKYFTMLEQKNDSEKQVIVSGFLSVDYDNTNKMREMFENWLYKTTEYTDKAVFSTDFESENEFAKYFLSTINLNAEKMSEVRALYNKKDYNNALKEYRNVILDKLRTADLGTFSYHDNVYNNKAWGEYFVGESKAPSSSGGFDVLVKLNFAGSPDEPINPDWQYSIQFPEQAAMVDLSYFNCLSPLAAKYFDTNDSIYLRKWMQITNVFATEHRRWMQENRPNDTSSNLCWNYKGAQSTLNQGNRTMTIIKVLGAFAKVSDKSDKPLEWSKLLEKRNPISDKSVYDIIDETEFANIVMSLVYDHSQALVERCVPYLALPNQTLEGLTALSYCDYFFSDCKKYENDYSNQILTGFNNYIPKSFFPDGGMTEQAFNYNGGDLSKLESLFALYEGSSKPEYINKLNENHTNAKKLQEAIAFPNGNTPAVGMGGTGVSGQYLTNKGFTSIAFPYIGFYSMRSGWGENDTNLFMQSPRRTSGHLYPSSNGIELYAKGRLLLMNGGAPWYAKNMAPSDQVGEYDQYNAYFGEKSSMNRNTVIVNGKSQNNSNYDGSVKSSESYTDTVKNSWHSSDSFDFVSANYDGGYGGEYGYTHNRSVLYVKDIDMNILSDSVFSANEVADCEAIWNFMPDLTGIKNSVNGFAEDEVDFDTADKSIKTSDSDGANLFMYNFYPESISYKKYYGYKGEDGYKGFYADGFGRRYPKVDIHTEWTEKGKNIPLVTLMETSFDTSSKINKKQDLSVNQEGRSYSGFAIKTADNTEVTYYSASRVYEFAVSEELSISSKMLVIVKTADKTKLLAIGAEGQTFESFEAELDGNKLVNISEIRVPSDFSWNESTPSYTSETISEELTNVKIQDTPYFAASLTAEYEYSGSDDALSFQWYSSVDGENWKLIKGETSKTYQIPKYKQSSIPQYYMVLVKGKTKSVFSNKTALCGWYFEDFENGNMSEIYNIGSESKQTPYRDYSIEGKAVTENGNVFLRFDYDDYKRTGKGGMGFDAGKSDVYLNRWWKPVDTLCVEQVSFRVSGKNARIQVPFMSELLMLNQDEKIRYNSSNGQGYLKKNGSDYKLSQNEWYTAKCLINPTENAIDDFPAKSYRIAVKANSESEWTVSDIISMPEGDYSLNGISNSMTSNDGKGNRFYIYLGSTSFLPTSRSRNIVDVDDYGVIPVISVEQTGYYVDYGESKDTVNCTIKVKNNDATQAREKTLVAAVYENGVLAGVKKYDVSLEADGEKIIDCAVEVNAQICDRVVKTFVFDNFELLKSSLKPFVNNNYN